MNLFSTNIKDYGFKRRNWWKSHWNNKFITTTLQHRRRSRQISGDAKDFYPNLTQTCPKSFCVTFFYKFSPTKIMKTFFWYDLQRNDFHVFFCKHWVPFLKWNNVGGIFPGLSGILPKFLEILPGFSTNQNFWGCACIPVSYTTVLQITHWLSVGFNFSLQMSSSCNKYTDTKS